MAFDFFSYKSDQGRFTRGLAFWLLTLLSCYGCQTFFYFLHWDWAKSNLLDQKMPILNMPLNLALIISLVLFLVIELVIYKLVVNRPKMGDLLIETETEMKKVTWPSWNDAFNSSIVVLIAVIFFMILLAVSDFLLSQVFDYGVFGMDK